MYVKLDFFSIGNQCFAFNELDSAEHHVYFRLLIHVNAAVENKSTMNARTVSQHIFANKTHNRLQLCILFNILFKMHHRVSCVLYEWTNKSNSINFLFIFILFNRTCQLGTDRSPIKIYKQVQNEAYLAC